MPFFRNASSNTHWSKDFIEHVRAIHFSLVLIGIGTILLSQAPDLEELQTAQHQLRLIKGYIEKQRRAIPEPTGSETWVKFTLSGSQYAARLPGSLVSVMPTCSTNFMDQVSLIFSKPTLENVQDKAGKIDTVEDFSQFWSFVTCSTRTGYLIKGRAHPLMFSCLRRTKPQLPYRMAVETRAGMAKQKFAFASFIVTIPSENARTLSMERMKDAGVRFHDEDYRGEIASLTTHIEGCDVTLMVELQPTLPSSMFELVQKDVIEWSCKSSFHECFPELSQLARGKTNYSLAALSDWIDYRVAHEESRRFEAFGIKAPSADEAYLTVFFTLAVLLYFWSHLKQLSPKVKPADTGLDVAWIGLYGSWIASLMVVVSIVLVPSLAITLMGLNRLHYRYRDSIHDALAANWSQSLLWVGAPLLLSLVMSISCYIRIRNLASLAKSVRGNDEESEKLHSLFE